MQADKGAIKFIMDGANIMCRGLTSPGGEMDDVPEGAVVAVYAEGKQHALAVVGSVVWCWVLVRCCCAGR